MQAAAGERVVWEIAGDRPPTIRFDGTRFGPSDADSAAEPVLYVVGESDPATGWPRVHPGPLNATTGFRELSAVVEFDLDSVPPGLNWALHVAVRQGSGPSPDFRIEVNGVIGRIALTPVRTDRSQPPGPTSAIAGAVDRRVPLPAGALTVGRNRIVLTTVHPADEPDPSELLRAQRPDLRSWFGSYLQWIRLALGTTTAERAEPTIEVAALPLYVERDGGLHEIVEIVVRNLPVLSGKAWRAVIDGLEHAGQLPGDVAFGDARIRLEVPDSGLPIQAAVEVDTVRWAGELTPARRWTVHVLPHVHLDIGYTDRQAKVIELHSRNVDKALSILDRSKDYAYSIDGSFIVQQFLRSRSQAQSADLVAALRAGDLGINAFWALLLTGVTGLEDLYRALYFAAALRREHGLPPTYANLTDVPSYSFAVPSVLAAAGIDRFMGILNHTRGGNVDSDELHLLSPVMWTGPDGGGVLAYFSDGYSQLRFICADPPTLAGCALGLTALLSRYERPDYLPDHLPLVGTHSDNEDLSHGYADLVRRWNAAYAWPKLVFSTMADYFAAVEPLRDKLPRLTGDGGSYWEDGVGTQARAIAVHRAGQTALPGVEAVSALVTADEPHLRPDTLALDEAWEGILIGSEHTWTSSHATEHPHSHTGADQLDWKVARIARGARVIADEKQRALSQLAERIDGAPVPGLLVVNAVSWARDVDVEVELPDGQGVPLPARKVATTGTGLSTWRVRVGELPAFGYRLLPIVAGDVPEESAVDGHVLETPYFTAVFDPATARLTGLRHRELAVELVDRDSPWTLGEVLYVTGGGSAELRGLGTETNSLYDYEPTLPPPKLITERATLTWGGVRRTPLGWTATASGHAPSLKDLVVRWHFRDDDDRVEVEVSFDKEPVLAKESVYVAFPFAVPGARVRYDRQQGWVNPHTDHHPGACNEWFTVQNAVVLTGSGHSVSWASAGAPLFALNEVVAGRWPTRVPPANGTVLSWVMNNYWWTNTPAQQDGPITLRYAFRPSREEDLVAARRLGRDLRTPALVSDVLHTDRCDDARRALSLHGSLYPVEVPDAVEVTVFAGRARSGVVVRAQETAGRTTTVHIPQPVGTMTPCLATATEDLIEPLTPDEHGGVTLSLRPYQVMTVIFPTG